MSAYAIEASGLGKRYRLGSIGVTSLREEATAWWHRVRGRAERARDPQEFWALRDVSFAVRPGEVIGVIGRNGAGKSTLLKILSRITEPTEGLARLRGRVASLLEVGTGFHPELTGRENVYLNGAILGMTRAEVARKFDEIVAFSEVEAFIDTPVKRYSSGMYVRLAFAVAAHLEPEILIVDEVLAVGDAAFQQKCIGKMRDVTRRDGRTILFVSHDMAAITALTQQCVLLERGRLAFCGSTAEAASRYFSQSAGGLAEYRAPGRADRQPSVVGAAVRTSEPGQVQAALQPLELTLRLDHPEGIRGAFVAVQLVNQFNQPATEVWLRDATQPFGREPGETTLVCRLPRVRLNVGRYSVRLRLGATAGSANQLLQQLDYLCPFEVVRLGETIPWGWQPESCAYAEEMDWCASAQPAEAAAPPR
jgi:lipopolysaccharide transport system ATP-binding protein